MTLATGSLCVVDSFGQWVIYKLLSREDILRGLNRFYSAIESLRFLFYRIATLSLRGQRLESYIHLKEDALRALSNGNAIDIVKKS